MISLYQLLQLLVLFPFVWIASFLFHEFFHVKARIIFGKNDTGEIQVFRYGFSAYREYVTNDSWFFLAGGLLSGTLFILIGLVLWPNVVIRTCLFTTGAVNIVYGFFEMRFLPLWGNNQCYTIGRYSLYCITTIVCMVCLLWWI